MVIEIMPHSHIASLRMFDVLWALEMEDMRKYFLIIYIYISIIEIVSKDPFFAAIN